MRVLNIDDNIYKKMAIKRALDEICRAQVEWAMDLNDAINAVRKAKEEGKPFDLIITDMNYPVRTGEPSYGRAGVRLIHKLQEIGEGSIPVIVCSTVNYQVEEAAGCVWYNDSRILSLDFKNILRRIRLL